MQEKTSSRPCPGFSLSLPWPRNALRVTGRGQRGLKLGGGWTGALGRTHRDSCAQLRSRARPSSGDVRFLASPQAEDPAQSSAEESSDWRDDRIWGGGDEGGRGQGLPLFSRRSEVDKVLKGPSPPGSAHLTAQGETGVEVGGASDLTAACPSVPGSVSFSHVESSGASHPRPTSSHSQGTRRLPSAVSRSAAGAGGHSRGSPGDGVCACVR